MVWVRVMRKCVALLLCIKKMLKSWEQYLWGKVDSECLTVVYLRKTKDKLLKKECCL